MPGPTFRQLLGVPDTPVRSFSFDPTDGELRVTGYTVEEVQELLAAYRNHMTLLADLTASLSSRLPGDDAVRYRPEGD